MNIGQHNVTVPLCQSTGTHTELSAVSLHIVMSNDTDSAGLCSRARRSSEITNELDGEAAIHELIRPSHEQRERQSQRLACIRMF
nr:hypothetical protein CFP56_13473 [Quercus suber]